MGVCGFAAAMDFRNKMPAKLHCYFGHSCLLVFISSSAEAKKRLKGCNWQLRIVVSLAEPML
jgi:hypothetical protein